MEFVDQQINRYFLIIFITILLLLKSNNIVYASNFYNKKIEFINKNKIYNYYRWKALLHYEKNKTTIIDENFWVSKEKTPKAELLEITKKIYTSNYEEKKYIVCKFPARIKFLVDELDVDKSLINTIKCDDFQKYLKTVSADKIYLSYASENIKSPYSMMGHLFLKIIGFNKDYNRIVENSLNYFAVLNLKKEGHFLFYIKSIFSGSSGLYATTPYRNKLIEYNDKGKRNIYDYELNLTNKQIEYLIYHIWELKDISVPYNFITHNCGTGALMVLKVMDENFEEVLNNMYITPIDIVKKLYQKNLIKNIELYPSDDYKIQMFKDNFSRKELINIKNFVIKNDDKILNNKRKNDLLFMADMVSGSYVLDKKIEIKQYKKIQDNIYNNFDGMNSINLNQITKNQLLSSFSSSFKFSYEKYKNNNGIGFNFYPVYKTINDDNSQYFNDFTLQLINIELFIKDKIILKNFELIKIKSLMPTSIILPTWSFNFKIGYQDSYEKYSNKGNFIGEIGGGKTITYRNFLNQYFIINGGFFVKPYLKFETGIILKCKNLKTIIEYEYFMQNNRNLKYIFALNENIFIKNNFTINVNFKKLYFENNRNSYNNGEIALKFYF